MSGLWGMGLYLKGLEQPLSQAKFIEAQFVELPPPPSIQSPPVKHHPLRPKSPPPPEPAPPPPEAAPPVPEVAPQPTPPPPSVPVPSTVPLPAEGQGARVIYRPMPRVPDDLREEALTAVAVARFRVDADGTAAVELITPTRNPRLNQVILDTLRTAVPWLPCRISVYPSKLDETVSVLDPGCTRQLFQVYLIFSLTIRDPDIYTPPMLLRSFMAGSNSRSRWRSVGTLLLLLYLFLFSIFASYHIYAANELGDPHGCSIGQWIHLSIQPAALFLFAVYLVSFHSGKSASIFFVRTLLWDDCLKRGPPPIAPPV